MNLVWIAGLTLIVAVEKLAPFGAVVARVIGAVLIAGAGHVRQDYGIPVYLASKVPRTSVISLAFLEVSQDLLDPRAYAARFDRQTLPFDDVWFTPRVDEQDPCVAFEESLKKLRRRPSAR